MSIYSEKLFPWGYDFLMKSEPKSKARNELLEDVNGEILEVGFGTGLNLAHYPKYVKQITTVDNNPGMDAKAVLNIAQSSISVKNRVADGEKLPFEDESFDSVITTYSLCSIKNAELALQEIKRVLKPDGHYYFLEHGLSNERHIQKWQHRLNPIQKVIAAGCHINRDIVQLIKSVGLDVHSLKNFYIKGDPKTHGFTYLGVAGK